jgi:hypothetical protein
MWIGESQMPLVEREVLGQRSWVLSNSNIEMAVTHLGAHMAPVEFHRTSGPVQPYYVSPWQGQGLELPEGLSEVPQRGDFFCLPFGLDRAPSSDELHRPHGETSSGSWTLAFHSEAGRVRTLSIQQKTSARVGSVERRFSLVEGHNVVYEQTAISGFAGPATFAHHAMCYPTPLPNMTRASIRPFVRAQRLRILAKFRRFANRVASKTVPFGLRGEVLPTFCN